jgi:RNA polymerase sigma factor (sigma-70 family)
MASDGFTEYIKDIVRYPLLTKEQEILLSRQVQAWVSNEAATNKEIRVGRRAYEKLINCNLRLVVSIAKRYTPHARRSEMFDIVQEGNIGLAHGVKKFDPERGYALSTYVYWWIRQSITRYLSCNDRIIRLPSHAVEMLSKVRAWKPEFFAAHGRQPTVEECAEYCNTNPRRMREYLERSMDCTSLDRAISGTEGDVHLIESITTGEHPMENLQDLLAFEEVQNLLTHLDDLDRSLIEGLFALRGGEPKTYLALAKEHGISRERARQRCQRALNRLRTIANRNVYVS